MPLMKISTNLAAKKIDRDMVDRLGEAFRVQFDKPRDFVLVHIQPVSLFSRPVCPSVDF